MIRSFFQDFFQRICPTSVNMNVGNNQQSSAAALCELDNLQLRANQVVEKYNQIQNHMIQIETKTGRSYLIFVNFGAHHTENIKDQETLKKNSTNKIINTK